MRVVHGLEDLENDLRRIGREFKPKAKLVVRETAREGNNDAKALARESSGEHARKYPGTFTAEMRPGFSGFGVEIIQAEYGPSARGQGNLASVLEGGTRNNPPHLNLTRSADPLLRRMSIRLGLLMDELFW